MSLPETDQSLFDGGPIYALLAKAGFVRKGLAGIPQRIAAFIIVTWGIAVVLAALQGVLYNPKIHVSFLLDYSILARFLIAGPLLIWADSFVAPWLIHVLKHFRRIVEPEDLPKFEGYIDTAVRRKGLLWVEVALVVFSFIRPHLTNPFGLNADVRSWSVLDSSGVAQVTWVSQWCMYVARPLIAWLWFRWLWRYLIWSMLLCKVAALKLRLTPTHPDNAGGLGFIAVGQTKFSILSFVFATQLAGLAADAILYHGATLMSYRYIIVGVVVLGLLIFLGPLLAFTPALIECKRRGIFEYGALSEGYVRKFHHKWIASNQESEEVEAPDDFFKYLSNHDKSYNAVNAMKFCIVTKSSIAAFVLSVLSPFAPLLLTAYPMDELLHHIFKSFL